MMGVLIKGIDMPTDGCRSCMFVNRKWHGDICPFLKKEVTGNVERGGFQTDCPLVPVPPHGDLIERNALGIRDAEKEAYEAYLREKGEFFAEEPVLEYMRGRLEGLTDASGRVRFAPTIIPAEEGE